MDLTLLSLSIKVFELSSLSLPYLFVAVVVYCCFSYGTCTLRFVCVYIYIHTLLVVIYVLLS